MVTLLSLLQLELPLPPAALHLFHCGLGRSLHYLFSGVDMSMHWVKLSHSQWYVRDTLIHPCLYSDG